MQISQGSNNLLPWPWPFLTFWGHQCFTNTCCSLLKYDQNFMQQVFKWNRIVKKDAYRILHGKWNLRACLGWCRTKYHFIAEHPSLTSRCVLRRFCWLCNKLVRLYFIVILWSIMKYIQSELWNEYTPDSKKTCFLVKLGSNFSLWIDVVHLSVLLSDVHILVNLCAEVLE